MAIRIKRAYERPAKSDGVRILVDRVWPRGRSKEELRLDRWEKEIAPSTALRKWFAHDPAKWAAFKRKYRAELKGSPVLAELRALSRARTVTLVYGAKDEEHNQAVALKEFLR
ncbi:MAG TPA: DUF488 family protein [Candidatus Paceibacterota bacterium]|nr:DUF488 family protein [Candidatus Paceibacterota bacterium]